MSSEDVTSIEPIKLAHKFIRIVDFNADPVTVYSASTGTVSYDSVLSPKRIKSEVALVRDAKQLFRQPPRPHHISKISKVLDVGKLEKPIPVDVDMLRELKLEEVRRRSEVSSSEKKVADWRAVNKELCETLEDSFAEFKKPRKARRVHSISVEFSPKLEKNAEFHIVKKTISPSLVSRIREKHGDQLTGLQIAEIACKIATVLEKSKQ